MVIMSHVAILAPHLSRVYWYKVELIKSLKPLQATSLQILLLQNKPKSSPFHAWQLVWGDCNYKLYLHYSVHDGQTSHLGVTTAEDSVPVLLWFVQMQCCISEPCCHGLFGEKVLFLSTLPSSPHLNSVCPQTEFYILSNLYKQWISNWLEMAKADDIYSLTEVDTHERSRHLMHFISNT